jgi:hypothetical protein
MYVKHLGGFEGGMLGPPFGDSEAVPPRKFVFLRKRVSFLPHFSCHLDFCVHCLAVFRHMIFLMVFHFKLRN